MKIELVPSILSSDFARLGAQAQQAIEGGGSVLHVDVMDGHFVPKLTVGPACRAKPAQSHSSPDGLPLDDRKSRLVYSRIRGSRSGLDFCAPGSVRALGSYAASDFITRLQTGRGHQPLHSRRDADGSARP